MALLTLTEIKTYLGETSTQWDSVISFLNDAVFEFLKKELGCEILRSDYSNEKITIARHQRLLFPKNYPVVSVASLTDSDGWAYIEDEDFYVTTYGIVSKYSLFSPLVSYYLSYTAGYDDNQLADLKQVALELIAAALKTYKDKSWGESSRSFPDGSITKREEFQLNPYQHAILNHYRRPVL